VQPLQQAKVHIVLSQIFKQSLKTNFQAKLSNLFMKTKILKNQIGFTLMEIMVAIVIIAILSTVGLVTYSSIQKNARISKRIQDLGAMKTALETYKAATGSYPNFIYTTAPTCANGGNASTALAVLVPTYMPSIPTDPLGGTANCYLYSSNAASASNEYKLRTNVVASEMDNAAYRTQPNLIDPRRDSGTVNCTVESGAVSAWAVYTSLGTTATNGCAY
jgi:prepilin-type N-terminal cleavage/methylation domain-containing protein